MAELGIAMERLPGCAFEVVLATGVPPRVLRAGEATEGEWAALEAAARTADDAFRDAMGKLAEAAIRLQEAQDPSKIAGAPYGVLFSHAAGGFRSVVALIPEALSPYEVEADETKAHAQVAAMARGEAVWVDIEARILRGETMGGEVLGRARAAGFSHLDEALGLADGLLQGAGGIAAEVLRGQK